MRQWKSWLAITLGLCLLLVNVLIDFFHPKHTNTVKLHQYQRKELLSVFISNPQIIDEFDTRLLVKGKVNENNKTDSYALISWDQYFTDLSMGSFTAGGNNGHHHFRWRMRAWHFLFKNISVVDNILKNNKPIIKVLDIGCAKGFFRRFLEGNWQSRDQRHLYYWGLDLRHNQLVKAVRAVDDINSGAKGNLIPSLFVEADTKYGLPFRDNQFDYVISFEMIKYLPIKQGEKLLAEIHRVLAKDGLFYFSTSYHGKKAGYMQNLNFGEIEHLLKKLGFSILERRGSQQIGSNLPPHLKAEHMPLINDLLKVHSLEMVSAMITPLYPKGAYQVTFICSANK